MIGNRSQVRAGQRFVPSAAVQNKILETIAYVDQLRNGSGGKLAGFLLDGCVYEIKNDSGADREAFDVLGIQAPLILPSANEAEFKFRPSFKGTAPALASYEAKWGILLEPIASGKIGKCCVAGVCPARVNVTDTSHEFAELASGSETSYTLESVASGAAQILWKATTSTGEQWCLVRIGVGGSATVQERRFILRSDLLENGMATAEWIPYRESEWLTCGAYDPTKRWQVCLKKPDRTFFYVLDSLCEFSGSANTHGGWAWIPDDMPTYQQICLEEGPPDWLAEIWQDDWVWDDRVWDIRRLVCANFLGTPCQDFNSDPCAAPEEE